VDDRQAPRAPTDERVTDTPGPGTDQAFGFEAPGLASGGGSPVASSNGQEPFRILPVGEGRGPDPASLGIPEDELRRMYRLMVLVRRADVEATALQRQGELAVYPPLLGQEAAQVASALALEERDWVFPSYRELGAALARGVDLVEYLHFYRGTWHGGTYDADRHRFGYVSVPVGSQVLHAVGYAMGTALDGLDVVSLVYFGDGATSEGDFHEGCNFAAVFRSPVVFFCQNNQWAISVPLRAQTVAPIWRKAEAYGFPGVQVDGNDALAVYVATREAVARARTGVPTLIEAVTYRMGPHSTADDATKYRSTEEVERWEAFDPLERYRRWLEASGLADGWFFDTVEQESKELAARLRRGVVESGPRPVEELFEWVFADLPEHLARQRDEVVRFASPDPSPEEEAGSA
jgi:2-oxoisovalerate dehydrogenase E1 component alpha subunit